MSRQPYVKEPPSQFGKPTKNMFNLIYEEGSMFSNKFRRENIQRTGREWILKKKEQMIDEKIVHRRKIFNVHTSHWELTEQDEIEKFVDHIKVEHEMFSMDDTQKESCYHSENFHFRKTGTVKQREFSNYFDEEHERLEKWKTENMALIRRQERAKKFYNNARMEELDRRHLQICSGVILEIIEFALTICLLRTDNRRTLIPIKQWRKLIGKFIQGKFEKREERIPERIENAEEITRTKDSHFCYQEPDCETLNEMQLEYYLTESDEWNFSHILRPHRLQSHIFNNIQRIVDSSNRSILMSQLFRNTYSNISTSVKPFHLIFIGKRNTKIAQIVKMIDGKHIPNLFIIDFGQLVTKCIKAFHEYQSSKKNNQRSKSTVAKQQKVEDKRKKKNKKKRGKNKQGSEHRVSRTSPVAIDIPAKDGLNLDVEFGKRISSTKTRNKKVPDEVLTELLIYHINSLPKESSWILLDFPKTYRQMKLLDASLWNMKLDNYLMDDLTFVNQQFITQIKEQFDVSERGSATSNKIYKKFFYNAENKLMEHIPSWELTRDLPPSTKWYYFEKLLQEKIEKMKNDIFRHRSFIDGVFHFRSNNQQIALSILKNQLTSKRPSISWKEIQEELINFQKNWPKMKKYFQKYSKLYEININIESDEALFEQILSLIYIDENEARIDEFPSDSIKVEVTSQSIEENENFDQFSISDDDYIVPHIMEKNDRVFLTSPNESVFNLRRYIYKWKMLTDMRIYQLLDVMEIMRYNRAKYYHDIMNNKMDFLLSIESWEEIQNLVDLRLKCFGKHEGMKESSDIDNWPTTIDVLHEELWSKIIEFKERGEIYLIKLKEVSYVEKFIPLINVYSILMQIELCAYQRKIFIIQTIFNKMEEFEKEIICAPCPALPFIKKTAKSENDGKTVEIDDLNIWKQGYEALIEMFIKSPRSEDDWQTFFHQNDLFNMECEEEQILWNQFTVAMATTCLDDTDYPIHKFDKSTTESFLEVMEETKASKTIPSHDASQYNSNESNNVKMEEEVVPTSEFRISDDIDDMDETLVMTEKEITLESEEKITISLLKPHVLDMIYYQYNLIVRRLVRIFFHGITIMRDLKKKREESFVLMRSFLGSAFYFQKTQIDELINNCKNQLLTKQHILNMPILAPSIYRHTTFTPFHRLIVGREDFLLMEHSTLLDKRLTLSLTEAMNFIQIFGKQLPWRTPSESLKKTQSITLSSLSTHMITLTESTSDCGALVERDNMVKVEEFARLLFQEIQGMIDNDKLNKHWKKFKFTQILQMVKLFTNNTDVIDWKLWLLTMIQPFPIPTTRQLVKYHGSLSQADNYMRGYIDKRKFIQIPFWFAKVNYSKIPITDESTRLQYVDSEENDYTTFKHFLCTLYHIDNNTFFPNDVTMNEKVRKTTFIDYELLCQHLALTPSVSLSTLRQLALDVDDYLYIDESVSSRRTTSTNIWDDSWKWTYDRLDTLWNASSVTRRTPTVSIYPQKLIDLLGDENDMMESERLKELNEPTFHKNQLTAKLPTIYSIMEMLNEVGEQMTRDSGGKIHNVFTDPVPFHYLASSSLFKDILIKYSTNNVPITFKK
ncbi:hypothetical protein SNEBB_010309 [Seison nebaliae]|nr:hypothetical protein SNEBB_010309 [Seison nebaliae]